MCVHACVIISNLAPEIISFLIFLFNSFPMLVYEYVDSLHIFMITLHLLQFLSAFAIVYSSLQMLVIIAGIQSVSYHHFYLTHSQVSFLRAGFFKSLPFLMYPFCLSLCLQESFLHHTLVSSFLIK